MQQVASEERIIPRSALRHRPIDPHPKKGVGRETTATCSVPRASRTTVRIQDRAESKPTKPLQTKEEVPQTNPPLLHLPLRPKDYLQSQHWLVLVGIGMLASILLVLIAQAGIAWGTGALDDLRYGRPRTFQTQAFVGHEKGKTPSHFIALNLDGRAEIIEIPGGDPAHARIFVGPQLTGPNADTFPVIIRFVDTEHDQKPDMLVTFHDTQMVLKNERGTFVLP